MDKQIKGGHHDSLKSLTFENLDEADLFFEKILKVFVNINSWGELFGEGTVFQLTDSTGIEKFRKLELRDLVKIKIPGPKSTIGEGSDWVEIAAMNFDEISKQYMIALSPTNKPGYDATAHFFQNQAKNYFIIKKSGSTITTEVHGRNEVPNYEDLPLVDKARNFLVAHKGILGFSKVHWETWCSNMLDNKYLEKCILKIKDQGKINHIH